MATLEEIAGLVGAEPGPPAADRLDGCGEHVETYELAHHPINLLDRRPIPTPTVEWSDYQLTG